MKPIEFCCAGCLQGSPQSLVAQILDLENWTSFRGYAFLPGIAEARFLIRTESLVGTRIAVRNSDGSTHVEEIVAWDGHRHLQMEMKEFSVPLKFLAERFEEHWHFGPTVVERRFRLFARGPFSRLLLCGVAPFLKRAVERHFQILSQQG